MSPGKRRVLRIALALACFLFLFAYGILAPRLTKDGPGQEFAFHLAYGLLLLGLAACFVRVEELFTGALRTLGQRPLAAALLLLNLALCGGILLYVFTEWGLIVLLGAAGTLLGLLAAMPVARVQRSGARWLVLSAVSFGTVYALLGLGELFLRVNPHLVGGDGGGNPALTALYGEFTHINERGLRGPLAPWEPNADSVRILALGDSFTFGQGVRFEETYPRVLEKLLDEQSTVDFDVINAGTCGVNTAWELEFLQTEGLRYQPDLVLLQFYLNDVMLSNPYEGAAGWFDNLLYVAIKRPLNSIYVLHALKYRFDKALEQGLRREGGAPPDYLSEIAAEVREEKPAWTFTQEALRGFARVSKETGLPVVVVVFPHPGSDHEALPIIHQGVVATCEEVGLPVLDLLGAFDELSVEEQVVSQSDQHPGAPMHAVAATELASFLGTLDVGAQLGIQPAR